MGQQANAIVETIIDTNFNLTPYFDDFLPNSEYYKVLFKPAVAVQARELNVLQTILQNQVTQFAENVLVEGTIVEGCDLIFNNNIPYVKILDNYANGGALTITNLLQTSIVSNSGLSALVILTQGGFVSQSPNLNTLYLQYLNSAANGLIKVFQNDEVLTVYNPANVVIGQITVANTISSGNSNTTGTGYLMSCSKGICFEKGIFLNVNNQTVVVTAYNNYPDGLSVGFNCTETIITAFQDPDLFDNSQGSPNYMAPGADRLQIIPYLQVIQTNNITNGFFSLVNFVGGGPSLINQNTVYSVIGEKMAEISYDTNGSFVINNFPVRVLQSVAANGFIDPNNLLLEIDSGSAYIYGYSVNLVGKLLATIPKSISSNNTTGQIITASQGNYLICNQFAGQIAPFQKVTLYNAPSQALTAISQGTAINSVTPNGSSIGTAYVLDWQYTGDYPKSTTAAEYYIYLFNINLTGNNSGNNIQSIFANNSGTLGFADVVLSGNSAVLNFQQQDNLIYSFNQAAVQTLVNSSNAVDTQFQDLGYGNTTFGTNGFASFTIPTGTGISELPYGTGQLINGQEDTFLSVIPTSSVRTPNIGGSVSITVATSNVVGVSTSFLTSVNTGLFLTVANSSKTETKQINSIVNNVFLTTVTPFANTWTAANAYITFASGENLPLTQMNANVYIINSTAFSVNMGYTVNTTFTAELSFTTLEITAVPIKKHFLTKVYALINCSNNIANTAGPYCLGIPDCLSVSNVWVGTTFSTANPSMTSNFVLKNGQANVYYGLGYLELKGITLSNTSLLMVEFQAFTPDYSQGQGFFSIDSYPIDDTGVTPNTIFTQDVPWFNSNVNLRNCMDFRVYAQNTIPYVTNTATANSNTAIINPSANLSFSQNNIAIPVPGSAIETSVQYYLGRIDNIGLSPNGVILINRGTPSETPVAPLQITEGMQICSISIPPYPSISVDVTDSNMPLTFPKVSITYDEIKRYTMADIAALEARISVLEKEYNMSQLETSTTQITLNANLFQNAIIVDPTADFSVCNTLDTSFNMAVDASNSVCRPSFSQYCIDTMIDQTTSNNVCISNDNNWFTINCTPQHNTCVSQPFACGVRNPCQGFSNLYRGCMQIESNSCASHQPDTTVNPHVVCANQFHNFTNLPNGWNCQWGLWNPISTTNTAICNGSNLTLQLQPFLPPCTINVTCQTLKPLTQHWPFFGNKPVSSNCVMTNANGIVYVSQSVPQQNLVSDANGSLNCIFYVPKQTFYSGNIPFLLVDVDDISTKTNVCTSVAVATHLASSLDNVQDDLGVNNIITQPVVTSVPQAISLQANSNYISNYNPVTNSLSNTLGMTFGWKQK